jgi:hypothetical protein
MGDNLDLLLQPLKAVFSVDKIILPISKESEAIGRQDFVPSGQTVNWYYY